MSVSVIARTLGIFPNAVYRSTERLEELGLIRRLHTSPASFVAIDHPTARNLFLNRVSQEFDASFIGTGRPLSVPGISVIRNQDELMRQTNRDVGRAESSVKLLVSGLEVSANTLAVYRKAVGRGVLIRALVQQRKETSQRQLQRWSEIGVEYRYTPYSAIRSFVIDDAISYALSYSTDRRSEAYGIRYDYAPFAVSMNADFESRWKSAIASA